MITSWEFHLKKRLKPIILYAWYGNYTDFVDFNYFSRHLSDYALRSLSSLEFEKLVIIVYVADLRGDCYTLAVRSADLTVIDEGLFCCLEQLRIE